MSMFGHSMPTPQLNLAAKITLWGMLAFAVLPWALLIAAWVW